MPERRRSSTRAEDEVPHISEEDLSSSVTVNAKDRLGGGASSRVYRATLGAKACALKLLHPLKSRKEHEVQYFVMEAAMLYKLKHRNIVSVFAICQVPPAFCGLPTRRWTWGMLLELVKGGNLTKWIMHEDQQYSDAEAASWCLNIAQALDYMHSQTPVVIHRDIKPDNVLISELQEGSAHREAKLADLGLHVALDSNVSVTSVRRRSGIIQLFSGSHRSTSHRSVQLQDRLPEDSEGSATCGTPSTAAAASPMQGPEAVPVSAASPTYVRSASRTLCTRKRTLRASMTSALFPAQPAQPIRDSFFLDESAAVHSTSVQLMIPDRPSPALLQNYGALLHSRRSFSAEHEEGSTCESKSAMECCHGPRVSQMDFSRLSACSSPDAGGPKVNERMPGLGSGLRPHLPRLHVPGGPLASPAAGTPLARLANSASASLRRPALSSSRHGVTFLEQEDPSPRSRVSSNLSVFEVQRAPSASSSVAAISRLNQLVNRMQQNEGASGQETITESPLAVASTRESDDSYMDSPSASSFLNTRAALTAATGCDKGTSEEQIGAGFCELGRLRNTQRPSSATSEARTRAPSECPGLLTREVSNVSSCMGWVQDADPGEFVYSLTGNAGTSIYRAPEIMNSEPYNEKIDIYSLGILMYEIFSRRMILADRSRMEIDEMCCKVLAGHRLLQPEGMNPSIWRLIQLCWQQNPTERPSASEVVKELLLLGQEQAKGLQTHTNDNFVDEAFQTAPTPVRVGSGFIPSVNEVLAPPEEVSGRCGCRCSIC